MSIIDKHRVATVAMLQARGYTYSLAEGWTSPAGSSQPVDHAIAEANAMHAQLVPRADAQKPIGLLSWSLYRH
jgi:hypothetical protein